MKAIEIAQELEDAVRDCEKSFTRLSNLLERLPVRNDHLGIDFRNADVSTKVHAAKWLALLLRGGAA